MLQNGLLLTSLQFFLDWSEQDSFLFVVLFIFKVVKNWIINLMIICRIMFSLNWPPLSLISFLLHLKVTKPQRNRKLYQSRSFSQVLSMTYCHDFQLHLAAKTRKDWPIDKRRKNTENQESVVIGGRNICSYALFL